MKKIATILVALMLAWAGITAQAQSTWKQTEREHVVPSVVENNMGDVVRCQLPETIVKGPIKVGLTAGEQAEYIQALWPDGESPRLYAAIFFQRPKETGEALYKKVVEKGDRILSQKGKNWVEALDVVSQQSNELSYTFTYLDDAQAEFWLVTAIGYGEGYQKGFAWDVLHYMRKGKAPKEDEGYPLYDDPEWYSYETEKDIKYIKGVALPNLPGRYGHNDLGPGEVGSGVQPNDYYETEQHTRDIKTFSHRKGVPKQLLQEDKYIINISNKPHFIRHETIAGNLADRKGKSGLYFGEELKNKGGWTYLTWMATMDKYDVEDQDNLFIESGTELYYRKKNGGQSAGSGYLYQLEVLGSIAQMKKYWLPAFKQAHADNNTTDGKYEVQTEEDTFCGYPALFVISTWKSKKDYKSERYDIPYYDYSIKTYIHIYVQLDVPEYTAINPLKKCFYVFGETPPDIETLKEEAGKSYVMYWDGGYCETALNGYYFVRDDIADRKQFVEEYHQKAYNKLLESLDNYEKMVKIKVDHKRKVLVDDYYVTTKTTTGEEEEETKLDSLNIANVDSILTNLDEKEKVGLMDKLVGWLSGDNEVLGEHTTATESVVISLIGILLASLLGSGGGGGGVPVGGGGDIPPVVDPETERLKELDRQQGQQWLKEQRAQNEAQWERERKTGVTETSRRHAEWKANYLAEEAKKERMRKLEEEFGTTDKATIMEKMKEKQAALEEVARKDKNTAAVWTAITGVTWAIDKGCDVAINVMGEIGGPGAKAIKNAYTLAKAPLKRVAEANVYNKGDEQALKTAAWQGVTEGLFGVLQNEAGRFSKSLGGWGEMTAVVGGEAAKGALNAYIQGGNAKDIAKEAAWAGAQKSIYYGIGKGVGALSKVKKDADAAPLIKKINDLQIKKLDLLEQGNIKEAVKVMQERGDTMRALAKLGQLGERLATKNASASQEFGAEFGVNPITDGIYSDAFKEAANALRSVMN